MQFTEVREHLSGEREESACVLLERSAERLVLRHDFALGTAPAPVDLPAGSRCLAYYWHTHPYNVYHWISPAGRTLAFSVNLSGPATIGDDHVHWSDLVVRLLLIPDETLGYRVERLGEDELPDVDDATLRHLEAAEDEALRSWPELVRFLSEHSARL